MLTKEQREDLKNRTVSLILEVRKSYLQAGASALKHWDQLQDRMWLAARATTNPDAWFSRLAQDLRLPPPSSSLSSEVAALREYVVSVGGELTWRRLVADEIPALLARARSIADARRDAREAQSTDVDALREQTEQTASNKPKRSRRA